MSTVILRCFEILFLHCWKNINYKCLETCSEKYLVTTRKTWMNNLGHRIKSNFVIYAYHLLQLRQGKQGGRCCDLYCHHTHTGHSLSGLQWPNFVAEYVNLNIKLYFKFIWTIILQNKYIIINIYKRVIKLVPVVI